MMKEIRLIRKFAIIFVLAITAVVFFESEVVSQTTPIGDASPLLESKLHRDISLDLRDMDVVDVYRFLALRGDFNTSISKNITGHVTLYLKDVTIRDALDIISLSNDLAYKVVGHNIIHVMTEAEYRDMYGKRFSDRREVEIIRLGYIQPSYALETLRNLKSDVGRVVIDQDTGSVVLIDTPTALERMLKVVEEMDQKLEVKAFDIQYADVEDVVSKLKRQIDNKAVGTTEADLRSSQIIVRAFPGRMNEIEKIIETLDRKTKAVLIDVRILKIVFSPRYDRGLDWRKVLNEMSNVALTAGSFSPDAALGTFGLGSMGSLAVANITKDGFTAALELMDEISSTKVLANPKLLVTENEEAKIHIGDKLAYVTTTTIGSGDSMRVDEEIHYLDVGVQFGVSPRINEDGYVTMRITPEISSQSELMQTPQGAQVPLINTTQLETEVIVKDKHTIVIAGLKQEEETFSDAGVSGLMNLPLLGRLFRHERKSESMTEIAILITPQIVTGREDYADEEYRRKTILKEYKDYE